MSTLKFGGRGREIAFRIGACTASMCWLFVFGWHCESAGAFCFAFTGNLVHVLHCINNIKCHRYTYACARMNRDKVAYTSDAT